MSKCNTSSRRPRLEYSATAGASPRSACTNITTRVRQPLAERLDQGRGDALSAMRLRHGEVVNVDLAALLLEFLQVVSGQAAHDDAILQRGERDEVSGPEQLRR